jgi:hypothetical protein
MKNCLKKKEHVNKTMHTTVISYILNFIQHYFVEVSSSVGKLLGAISVDFNGTAPLLIIYSALIKKSGIQRKSSSAIYSNKQNLFSILVEIMCNSFPKFSTPTKLLIFIKCV